jgi:CDP-6-deoxy-D-xylo-4-hexulose-3-dehydrase
MATITMKNDEQRPDYLDHPLMRNNITAEDLDKLISYLKQDNPKLTQGSNVLSFEEEWSEWLGVKYSVYVNSGSSANLITLGVLKQLYGGGDVIVPPLTWVSDIAACLQNGFSPVFADINPNTLALDTVEVIRKITPMTRAVFLTHVQGFNGLTSRLLEELEQRCIPLIEDVSESHGAMYQGRKLGTFGLMSNFSFYYAHHMSTIEGGMVCTDNEDIYQMLRMYRSHGMVRESNNLNLRSRYATENKNLNIDFIFAFPGYNVRNTEIGGIIGRSQLKRLDENNGKRKQNQNVFLNHLDEKLFRVEFDLDGSCNYAFNVILREADLVLRDRVESAMEKAGVEYRRGSSGGGNQLRQPYLKGIVKEGEWLEFPEVEHVHFFGWYIGNHPDLAENEILQLCELLNNA